MEPTIALVEVFAAPQGEGYNAGRWAVFVRLAGCPLACEFAPGVVCDTPYQQVHMKVTLDELFENIERTRAGIEGQIMLILTGGEPTATPQFDAIMKRAALLSQTYLAVETNGTQWREGLGLADWLSVSPKDTVPQTSKALHHNLHPRVEPRLDAAVKLEMKERISWPPMGGEYRYVITADSPTPPFDPAPKHYISPVCNSDGRGQEWKEGFPGFAPGAVERCMEIVQEDPRWQISTQQHKIWGVR